MSVLRGLMAISLLAASAAGLAGEVAARRWWPAWGGTVIAASAGVNLAGCWVSFLPVGAALKRGGERLAAAILTATLVRLVVVGVGASAMAVLGPWGVVPVALWAGVFYLCLLGPETGWTARLVKRCCERKGGPATT